MIQDAVERILPYAECYGVRIYTNFLIESMQYKIRFMCGNLVSDVIISDFDLCQQNHPKEYLDCIMKDGVDLIYQAWRSVK